MGPGWELARLASMSYERFLHSLFLSLALVAGGNIQAQSADNQAIAEDFLKQWDQAWAARDGHALAALHTQNAVTVNRYGKLLAGREQTEKWLTAMLGPQGSFTQSTFPPMKLLAVRRIAPDVVVAQTGWKAPALQTNGKVDPGRFNDMIITYVLVKEGAVWRAAEIDPHNVEKVDTPFSQPGQKN
jgi:uncharacterized protein (TIGR02246 family)